MPSRTRDGARADQRSGQGQAWRGDRHQDADIACHGERFPPQHEIFPRDIITGFVATYNGTEIFRATLFPAIAANPFIAFHTVAVESGTIEFEWTGDNGYAVTEQAKIIVE